jgi:glycosyltransferase involved in cell wall biosynthesis
MSALKIVLFANTDWYIYNFRRSLVLALREAGYRVLVVTPPGPYGAKIRGWGVEWVSAPMERRSLNPFRELILLWWLVRLFRREQVGLVHSFTIKCAVYGGLAARIARVPACVHAVVGLGYVFIGTTWRARCLRFLASKLMRVAFAGDGSRLILQNPDDVALFATLGLIDSSKIRLIKSSGVNCQRFSAATARQLGSPLRVLMACRLLWDKGLREFVKAARILKAEGRNVEFLLAGQPDPGNPASATEQDIQAWVEEGLITWLGQVDDMAELLSSVHVVTLPTSYREGVPRILIEAAACGLPIVTTDAPGCREVVTHEVDGLLIPLKDAGALARAIARLEDEPELAERLGAAAQRKARTEFSEEKVISETLAVYQELSET